MAKPKLDPPCTPGGSCYHPYGPTLRYTDTQNNAILSPNISDEDRGRKDLALGRRTTGAKRYELGEQRGREREEKKKREEENAMREQKKRVEEDRRCRKEKTSLSGLVVSV
jgi:hypothetical protein